MKTINPVAAWHEEHVYFNQLLNLLRREVDVFHTGERPKYELMYDIISYLRATKRTTRARTRPSSAWRSAVPI